MANNLLSMFQELCHYWNELGKGSDTDVVAIIDELDKTRQQWLSCYNDNVGLKNLIKQFEQELVQSRHDQKELKVQLIEARSQIAALVSSKQTIETEKVLLEEQIQSVRHFLRDVDVSYLPEPSRLKLVEFRDVEPKTTGRDSSASIISDDDLSYDKTDENLDASPSDNLAPRCSKKRSFSHSGILPTHKDLIANPDMHTPPKRFKDVDDVKQTLSCRAGEQIVATTTVQIPFCGPATAKSEMKRTSLNRSFSEPNVFGPGKGNEVGLRSENIGERALHTYGSAASLSSRQHVFLSHTILRPQTCDQCSNRIGFAKQAYTCEECKTTVHYECRNNVALPCVPRNTTPNRKTKGVIADFVPSTPPMVPHLLIRCIGEIESRGLNSVGLYRIPGTENQVVDITERILWGKSVPNLKFVDDVNILCGVVKKFLTWLKEPLVTPSSWHQFTRAAEQVTVDARRAATLAAVNDLPQPNRDTLAYLILHLQRVSDKCALNLMPASNLAKVFGPTVVGYSVNVPCKEQMLSETTKQALIVDALLDLPADYWSNVLEGEAMQPLFGSNLNFKTPEHFQAPLLGPFGSATTPNSYRTRPQAKRFFQPPWK